MLSVTFTTSPGRASSSTLIYQPCISSRHLAQLIPRRWPGCNVDIPLVHLIPCDNVRKQNLLILPSQGENLPSAGRGQGKGEGGQTCFHYQTCSAALIALDNVSVVLHRKPSFSLFFTYFISTESRDQTTWRSLLFFSSRGAEPKYISWFEKHSKNTVNSWCCGVTAGDCRSLMAGPEGGASQQSCGPTKTESCLNTYFHWDGGGAAVRALIRILQQAGLWWRLGSGRLSGSSDGGAGLRLPLWSDLFPRSRCRTRLCCR